MKKKSKYVDPDLRKMKPLKMKLPKIIIPEGVLVVQKSEEMPNGQRRFWCEPYDAPGNEHEYPVGYALNSASSGQIVSVAIGGMMNMFAGKPKKRGKR